MRTDLSSPRFRRGLLRNFLFSTILSSLSPAGCQPSRTQPRRGLLPLPQSKLHPRLSIFFFPPINPPQLHSFFLDPLLLPPWTPSSATTTTTTNTNPKPSTPPPSSTSTANSTINYNKQTAKPILLLPLLNPINNISNISTKPQTTRPHLTSSGSIANTPCRGEIAASTLRRSLSLDLHRTASISSLPLISRRLRSRSRSLTILRRLAAGSSSREPDSDPPPFP